MPSRNHVDGRHPQATCEHFVALRFPLSLRFRRSKEEPMAYFPGTGVRSGTGPCAGAGVTAGRYGGQG
ncbi:hypothetical protein ERO13_A11G049650v2 [Gossypium hirsutum]|nr:hypothetical protein ERO13_A11G049650v2 [Gossypium hirsutum]